MGVLMRMALLAAGLAAAAGVGAAGLPEDFVGLFKAATEAYEAKDYPRMEQKLREALKLRPGHPRALYNLASALALGGHKNAALIELRKLERMGLSFEVGQDEDFAGMREWQGFKDVSRAFARNRRSAGEAKVTFRVPAPAFIPEGLAYDDDSETFFLGSVHERRIRRIRDDGTQDDFVAPGSVWAVLGLAIDSEQRRLWAATAAIAEMKDAKTEELGRSAILAYDLKSGALKQRYAVPEDGRKHSIGDLIVSRSGTVYATDSASGDLFALDPASGKFDALTVAGALASPQGLALARDRRRLYVADYTQGLYRYDLEKRALTRLDVAEDICVYGIDGLYRFDDDLIAVQNGIRPHRVVRFELDRGGKRVRHASVLAASLTEFDEPTLGVVVGRRFHFVANSQWNRFGQDHALPPEAQLRGPVVLEVALDRRRNDAQREPRSARGVEQQPAPLELPPVGLPPIR